MSSLPELPPLGGAGLSRCASSPAPPAAALPRHVAPPHVATDPASDAVDARLHAKMASSGAGLRSEITRSATSSSASHLLVVPHHELPPIRAPMLHSRGSSRLQASPATKGREMRGEIEFFYDTLGGESKSSALGQRPSTRTVKSKSLATLDTAAHSIQEESRLAAYQEIESLKKQVSQLTQVRIDRDTYIQDLLAAAEAEKRRSRGGDASHHDLGAGHRRKRIPSEAGEERGRAHAAAFAHQALQHEQELGDLRKTLRSEHEQQLTRCLAEHMANSESTLARLQAMAQQLQQQLARHSDTLLAAFPASSQTATLGTSGFSKGFSKDTPASQPWGTPASTDMEISEPDPELASSAAGDRQAEAADSQQQPVTSRGAEAVEQALEAARADLERAIAAGHRAVLGQGGRSAHDCFAETITSSLPSQSRQQWRNPLEGTLEEPLPTDSVDPQQLELRRDRRNLGMKVVQAQSRHWEHAVFLTWRHEIQRSRAQREREECTRTVRSQTTSARRRLRTLSEQCVQASIMQGSHIAFQAWAAVAAEAARSRELEAKLAKVRTEVEGLQLQVQGVQAKNAGLCTLLRSRTHMSARLLSQRYLRAGFVAWAIGVNTCRREAAYRHKLLTNAAESNAQLYTSQVEFKRTTAELRRQRRAHGVAAIHASLDRRLQAVVHAWSVVARDAQREAVFQRQLDISSAESAAGCAVQWMEGRRIASELRQQRRTQALRAVRGGLRHWKHVILYAWVGIVAEERREALFMQDLSLATAQVDLAQLEAERESAIGRRHQEANIRARCQARDSMLLAATLVTWSHAAHGALSSSRRAAGASAQVLRVGKAVLAKACERDGDALLTIAFLVWHRTARQARRDAPDAC